MKSENLIAACWAMYSAIQQAQACDIYNYVRSNWF